MSSVRSLAPWLLLFVVDLGDGTGDRLKELRTAYKAKESATAVRLFDELAQAFDAQDAKTQGEIVKAVEAAFPSRRDEGDDVEHLFIGAAAALANMGEGGEKAIERTLKVKHVLSRPAVVATLVEGLGQQTNPAEVDLLIAWLTPEKPLGVHAPIVAAAVRALGRYREAKPEVRKKTCGALVGVYSQYAADAAAEKAKAKADANVEIAYQQIEVPLLHALRALSGATHENAADWSAWWATAKAEEWKGSRP
jgi:hypothetical protein